MYPKLLINQPPWQDPIATWSSVSQSHDKKKMSRWDGNLQRVEYFCLFDKCNMSTNSISLKHFSIHIKLQKILTRQTHCNSLNIPHPRKFYLVKREEKQKEKRQTYPHKNHSWDEKSYHIHIRGRLCHCPCKSHVHRIDGLNRS